MKPWSNTLMTLRLALFHFMFLCWWSWKGSDGLSAHNIYNHSVYAIFSSIEKHEKAISEKTDFDFLLPWCISVQKYFWNIIESKPYRITHIYLFIMQIYYNYYFSFIIQKENNVDVCTPTLVKYAKRKELVQKILSKY